MYTMQPRAIDAFGANFSQSAMVMEPCTEHVECEAHHLVLSLSACREVGKQFVNQLSDRTDSSGVALSTQ
jgi:hypothetical protein